MDTPWPKADPALLADDQVTIAVQVNGKRRDEITVPKDLDAKPGRSPCSETRIGFPGAGGAAGEESDCGARPDRQYCRLMRKAPAILLVAAALLLAGCGYRPLYGSSSETAGVAATLSSISIPEAEDRVGPAHPQ